jgi:hypothetical protein
MSSPYTGLPDHQFWRRAVSRVETFRLDPVIATRFIIAQGDRVATAGSCFAQHIARSLRQVGDNYYVAEAAPEGLTAQRANELNYGVFSARYGNIYTARQLLQLFEEAHGRRQPHEATWQRADGRFVDPYRPQIEPAGFATEAEVAASRTVHLEHVRAMFGSAQVFIFTLGLTEAWRSRLDGAVFPLAPGVAGGSFDAARHEFVNFTAAEVEADLHAFMAGLASVNTGCRVILTVSPVPLIATYEQQHVLVSTTYSKSALRVAAEGVVRAYSNAEYFPSYEIITGAFNRGAYYENDLRDVTRFGVDHAMRVFLRHYTPKDGAAPLAAARGSARAATLPRDVEDGYEVVCDEEAIDQVRLPDLVEALAPSAPAPAPPAPTPAPAPQSSPAHLSSGWLGHIFHRRK